MKQIINGRKYDTDTATCLHTWSNGLSYRDFSFCEESLYRKRTGEYFLYGEGGANTGWAFSCGLNCWSAGYGIHPLTLEGAMQWGERHLKPTRYEEIFGPVDE